MNKLLNLLACAAIPLTATVAYAQPSAPAVEAYGNLPQTEDIAISPDGHIAMVATVKGNRMLLVFDNQRNVINSMLVGDIKVRDIRWVGNENVVLTRTDTQELGDRFWAQSAEFANAMIIPVSSDRDVKTVFADDQKVLSTIFGTYGYRQIDGEWYGFFGGSKMERNRGGYYFYSGNPAALYRVKLSDNTHEQISKTPAKSERVDWLIDTNGEIAAEMLFYPETRNWRVRNSAGTTIASGQVGEKGGTSLSAFGRTPGTALFYTRQVEDGDLSWYEVPLDGSSEAKQIFVGKDIYSIRTDPGTSQIIAYREEGSRYDDPGEWVYYDDFKQAEATKIYSGFSHVNGSILGFTPDFSKVLVHTNGNADSGTWYQIDTTAKSATVLAKSYPSIQPSQVGPISVYEYAAQDGIELDGILTLPPGREPKNLPAIMLPHGGPQSYDRAHFDWWAQAFASQGYAVFQPNFRGSTNRDDAFIDLGNGEWGKKMQSDISDGMMALASEGIINPSRVCIMGASYGGYAAMAGITLEQGKYQCSVAVAGVSDLRKMVSQEQREGGSRNLRDFREETMGPREQMHTISPRFFADKADAPILLIHGRDDTVVPIEQSEIFAEALKKAGKPYQFVELTGEDHWLSRSATRQQMLKAAIEFVQEHNPAD